MPPPDSRPIGVLIGADSIVSHRSGVGRMTLEIARAARLSAEVARVDLLVGGAVAGAEWLDESRPAAPPLAAKPWKVAVGRVPGMQALRRIKHGGLKKAVRTLARESAGRTVYHEPNMIASVLRLPTVVTMNDLSWLHEPGWHPADRLDWIHRNLDATLRRATGLIAISRFTRDAVVRQLGVPPGKIDVVHLAPAAAFQPMAAEAAAPVLARYGLADRRYVLSISTLEPRKNFDRLLRAHARLPAALRAATPLVIAGGRGWGDVLTSPAASQAIADGTLRLLGHIPDAELAALCARAGVFAYVSLYEGFGLPVIEAMASGTPVVASNTTAVGEVADEAAVTVDPLDEAAIAEGLRHVLEDPALADTLREAGLRRAASFTWGHTLDALVGCWRKALT